MTAGIIMLARHRSTVIKNKKNKSTIKNRGQRKFDVHTGIVAKRKIDGKEKKRNLRIITVNTIGFSLFGIPVVLAGISLSSPDRWHIRRIDILSGQTVPSYLCKPRMALHIF